MIEFNSSAAHPNIDRRTAPRSLKLMTPKLPDPHTNAAELAVAILMLR